jgi:hypothetical protein
MNIPRSDHAPDLHAPQRSLLTAAEVAKILSVSQSWVREHSTTKTPRLPAMKMGSGKTASVRYHPADIMDFVDDMRRSAKDRAAGKKWRN